MKTQFASAEHLYEMRATLTWSDLVDVLLGCEARAKTAVAKLRLRKVRQACEYNAKWS